MRAEPAFRRSGRLSQSADAFDRLSDPVPPHKTAMGYRHERNKFEVAGLSPIPSAVVKPPRIAECPIHLEAVLKESHAFGQAPYREKATAVAMEVRIIRAWVDDSIRLEGHENRIHPDRWRPLIMSFGQFYGLGSQLQ